MKVPPKSSLLEDAFFLKQDQLLIKKLEKLEKMNKSKETLREVSGITNEEVLEKLVNLQITPQAVAALAVVPLIEVAWADGQVDEREKFVILSQIEKHGIQQGSTEHELTELWLSHRPDKNLLTAWAHLVKDICSKMNPAERKQFQDALINDAQVIANASGGFLGLGKVSKEENQMLQTLADAFAE